jgi:predicted AAA+ superfamily ATPase
VESAVGAHLAKASAAGGPEVTHWRERNREADFVLRSGARAVGIEVKSGRSRDALPGIAAFADAFQPARILLVGAAGVPFDEFLSRSPTDWLRPWPEGGDSPSSSHVAASFPRT